MASGKSNDKLGSKSAPRAGKLGQTLHDLEAALNDWDALSDTPAEASSETSLPPNQKKAAPSAKDVELRKKTKKLLDQLREQLAELAD